MGTYRTFTEKCYICNEIREVARHHGELLCENCYQMVQRIRRKHKKNGDILTKEEFMIEAATRRFAMKGTDRWAKKNLVPNTRIGILK